MSDLYCGGYVPLLVVPFPLDTHPEITTTITNNAIIPDIIPYLFKITTTPLSHIFFNMGLTMSLYYKKDVALFFIVDSESY